MLCELNARGLWRFNRTFTHLLYNNAYWIVMYWEWIELHPDDAVGFEINFLCMFNKTFFPACYPKENSSVHIVFLYIYIYNKSILRSFVVSGKVFRTWSLLILYTIYTIAEVAKVMLYIPRVGEVLSMEICAFARPERPLPYWEGLKRLLKYEG